MADAKKTVHLPAGTFLDRGRLEKGKPAYFQTPNGQIIRTSAVINYFVSSQQIYIETKNTYYTTC